MIHGEYLGDYKFYYEDPCFLCRGAGKIASIYIKINRNLDKGMLFTCHMCEGKGFLKIEKGDLEL